METLYKKDKVVALTYIAAENEVKVTYRCRTDETRLASALCRKRQRNNHSFADDDADFGPPDKRRNFQKSVCGKKKSIKVERRVEVKYDDNIWYKGTLIEHKEQNDEWIAIFDIDGEKTTISFPDEDVRLL